MATFPFRLQINTIYFLQSVWECFDEVLGKTLRQPAESGTGCSLSRSISTMLLLVSLLTSASLFGFKAAMFSILQLNWKEREALVSERTNLLRRLEANSSPDRADSATAAQADGIVATVTAHSRKIAPLRADTERFDQIVRAS